jgi:hypothetical protein
VARQQTLLDLFQAMHDAHRFVDRLALGWRGSASAVLSLPCRSVSIAA